MAKVWDSAATAAQFAGGLVLTAAALVTPGGAVLGPAAAIDIGEFARADKLLSEAEQVDLEAGERRVLRAAETMAERAVLASACASAPAQRRRPLRARGEHP